MGCSLDNIDAIKKLLKTTEQQLFFKDVAIVYRRIGDAFTAENIPTIECSHSASGYSWYIGNSHRRHIEKARAIIEHDEKVYAAYLAATKESS